MSQDTNHIRTINDLTREEYIKYKDKVNNHYNKTIKKYLNYRSRNILAKRSHFFSCIFMKEKRFVNTYSYCTGTNIRYSTHTLSIPIEFDVIMECILQKDLNTKGIFRVSANYNELNNTEKTIVRMFAEKRTKKDLFDYLIQKDVILLCNLFTRIFKLFETTLFPQSLIDLALTCFKIEAEEDRVIFMRMIILGFHYHNRQLFESISKFTSIVSEQNCKNDFHLTQSMSLNSICKVLAPKIFIKKNEMVNPYKLCNYVDLLEYLFENMEAIIQIDPVIEI